MSGEDLQTELARLRERSADLAEDGGGLPRGALPALFRALTAASPEARTEATAALAERLPDWPLVRPTLAAARELGLAEPLVAGWRDPAGGRGAWCSHQQVAALVGCAGDAGSAAAAEWVLDAVEALVADAPGDPTELALRVDPAAFGAALEQVLRLRLRTPSARRDRTSTRLAEGALGALVAIAPDGERVQQVVAQVLAAEARRAGKAEPTLALRALDALGQVPPVPRLRLLAKHLAGVKRPKVSKRMEAAHAEAADELGAGPAEVAELTARTGDAGPDGWVRVPLDDGGEAGVRIGRDGAPERRGQAPAAADRRALDSAERELRSAWDDGVRRLEDALVSGRSWPLPLWEAIFAGDHPLLTDLAGRLLWELRREGQPPLAFATGPDGPRDLFGEPLALSGDEAAVGLVHPTRLDPDELELWREWALDRGLAAPFPQLFRAVAAPDSDDPFADLAGREAYRSDVLELLPRLGWSGVPLRGAAPWELEKDAPSWGVRVRLRLEEVKVAFKATLAQRKAAHRKAREGEKVVIRGHGEAKPRLRIAAVRADGDAPVVLAEARADLHALSDGLATPDELALRAWQKEKWRDPQASWRDLVLAYRRGSAAALAARRALIAGFAARAGLTVRLEDRFAITGNWVVELGTGLCHEGPPKDYLPAWKVDELLAEEADPPPPFPFVPDADPAAAEVVTRVIGLARKAAAAEVHGD